MLDLLTNLEKGMIWLEVCDAASGWGQDIDMGSGWEASGALAAPHPGSLNRAKTLFGVFVISLSKNFSLLLFNRQCHLKSGPLWSSTY